MAEEQRRLLEQLMGKDAMINPIATRREPDMSSPRVCKSFLVGTCPHDLFVGTKQDIGRCSRLHLQKHKLEFEYRTKKLKEEFPSFELEYFNHIKEYIYKLDKVMADAQQRLTQTTPEEQSKIETITKELYNLDIKIGLMTQEIDCLVKEGEIQKSLYETVKLNELCKERDVLAANARTLAENVGQTSQQKLQVCEGCGAYLSRLDSDRRLADHFIGKIHMGYVQMRQAYEELKPKIKKLNASRSSIQPQQSHTVSSYTPRHTSKQQVSY
ncbi:U1 snRNP protein [Scheffersomyces coipomensis]|uniref:U1 snRNP protein n=1 Tax=Scheffersomyces coipomensis TaxID=1788519 RepID=UPI00315CE853